MMKEQKGITLVALVITIIVMIILVGVSVTIALQGGLFSESKNAAEDFSEAAEEEYELSSGQVNVDGNMMNITDYYINSSSN